MNNMTLPNLDYEINNLDKAACIEKLSELSWIIESKAREMSSKGLREVAKYLASQAARITDIEILMACLQALDSIMLFNVQTNFNLDSLLLLLDKKESMVVEFTIGILGSSGNLDYREHVEKFMYSPDAKLRNAAIEALRELDYRNAQPK